MTFTISILSANLFVVELTTSSWQVFTAGRVIAYLGVGLVENAVPSYQAELAPAPLRGFFAGSIMLITSAGNLWGTGMSRAYATETGNVGWMVPVGVQLIPAVFMLLLTPFTVGMFRFSPFPPLQKPKSLADTA